MIHLYEKTPKSNDFGVFGNLWIYKTIYEPFLEGFKENFSKTHNKKALKTNHFQGFFDSL
ncbi:hypothetical protein [Flavobacterium pectinovorum]|uniref:Uncharacterized protein n=1 Tax=Flavobacterium pectinovorum TaxID=29533 RepID=A0A502EMK3_9FLAO|nr:hypothetical protein [Flavobacterium pectinovorum]TPG37501.1 hypothetical protein EAH81_18595 [Flavobacterium pectinovorum]